MDNPWSAALVLVSLLPACAHETPREETPRTVDVPAAIAVKEPGLHVLATLPARGAQVYQCSGTNAAAPYTWTLVGPEATLFDASGAAIGTHSKGPTWELPRDGSKVTATVEAKAAVEGDAVPWLLLRVASNAGSGVLGKATLIQRVETHGGVAPNTPCDAATGGTVVKVAYTASYVFWGPP
jgi:hypothetical protein